MIVLNIAVLISLSNLYILNFLMLFFDFQFEIVDTFLGMILKINLFFRFHI
jgi:hypothetical protein